MIVSKENMTTIATKFSEVIRSFKPDNAPRYIDVWPEHNVEAIRLVTESRIDYSIAISGEELCRVDTLNHHGQLLVDPINEIANKLINGSQKYITQAINREVESIIETVRDIRFNYSLFTGGLSAVVSPTETKNGTLRFIDVHQGIKMVYSAPHNTGNENALRDLLTEVLKKTYLSNGMSISIP